MPATTSLYPALVAAICGIVAHDIRAQSVQVEVEGRTDCDRPIPVLVTLDPPDTLAPGNYELIAQGRKTTAAVFDVGDRRWLAIALDRSKRGERVLYDVKPEPVAIPHRMRIVQEADRIDIFVNDQLFTSRHPGPRKPYFYPLLGPDGVSLTRSFPMEVLAGETKDHPHQRSFWVSHGDVNGVDFWASDPLNGENPRFGSIRECEVITRHEGPLVAALATRNDWLDEKEHVLCTDTRTWVFWGFEDMRVIDARVRLEAAETSVTFGDTKEGFFGLRVASSLDANKRDGGRIVNAEGIVDSAAWGKQSAWVDYSGPVESRVFGIGILNHPSSFRYPTAWHVRDYGLFAANPFGKHDFRIDSQGELRLEPGESVELTYRLILHRGNAEQAEIANQFTAYADAPAVRVRLPKAE